MPELPEVETVRRYLSRLEGWRIDRAIFRRADLRYPIPIDAATAMQGHVIIGVRRRAKYLLIDAGPQAGGTGTLLIHLGMSGRLFLDETADPAFEKHEHARWSISRGASTVALRFVDARRFGAIDILSPNQEATHKLLASLGPEPLDDTFDTAHLYRATRGKKVAIKILIMNAKHVVGVGNIYASEACWRARISPKRAAKNISKHATARLVTAIKDVLAEAVQAGGTTLKDFVGGDAAPGYFQQRLDVYGRAGESCHRCPDSPVRNAVIGQRMTYWCPRCQR